VSGAFDAPCWTRIPARVGLAFMHGRNLDW
jgi:hypothetical protein